MSDSNAYPSEQQLAQTALDHVRALCKGNGVKAGSITITKQDIQPHTLHAHTYLELKPVTNEKIMSGKISSGTMAGSQAEAMKLVDQAMVTAASNPSTRTQITHALLSRPDKGFGLHHQAIPVEFLKQEYTYHEACSTCRGAGNSGCTKCHGRRTETCIKCTGRGLMLCPLCRGTGLINGQKCTRCSGQRYYPCDMCKKMGVMRCRTCAGSGQMKCPSCEGQGWKSHILSLSVHAMTYFQYDAKSVPKGAADVIETGATSLAAEKKVRIEGRAAEGKDNSNVLGASYEVHFPYGEVTFQIGGRDVTGGVFGYKADLVNMPTFLDRLIFRGVEELEEAAKDAGSVSAKIRMATKYRLIAHGFLLASKTNVPKAKAMLMKKYDVGLSESMAEKIVTLADRSMAQVTKKPRMIGMAAGLGGAFVISALYYLAPVRSLIAAYMPDPRFDIVLDIVPIVLGGILTNFAIQKIASKSVHSAIGHLIPPQKKKELTPKLGNSAWIGYIASILFALVMMTFAMMMAKPVPYWFQLFTGLFLN